MAQILPTVTRRAVKTHLFLYYPTSVLWNQYVRSTSSSSNCQHHHCTGETTTQLRPHHILPPAHRGNSGGYANEIPVWSNELMLEESELQWVWFLQISPFLRGKGSLLLLKEVKSWEGGWGIGVSPEMLARFSLPFHLAGVSFFFWPFKRNFEHQTYTLTHFWLFHNCYRT